MKKLGRNYSPTQMVSTTRYSDIFQKIPRRVRVAQKIPSSFRVAGTRWGLMIDDYQLLASSPEAYMDLAFLEPP